MNFARGCCINVAVDGCQLRLIGRKCLKADAVCCACAGQARSLFRTGATMERSRAVFITGIIYALIGLVLAGGGIWLAALGGSIFYIILGVGILATGALLLAQRRSALWLFAIVLVGTLAWGVYEGPSEWWVV